MKVRIDAGGRAVEIECSDANVTAKDVADVALATWHETSGSARGTEGPAYGFTPERRTDPAGYQRFNHGSPTPIRAEDR